MLSFLFVIIFEIFVRAPQRDHRARGTNYQLYSLPNTRNCLLITLRVPQRTSKTRKLSLTNRATHLCKYNGMAELLTTLFPYMLPRRIGLFSCTHKYRRTRKIGVRQGHAAFAWGVADRLQTSPSLPICVTMPNRVVFVYT